MATAVTIRTPASSLGDRRPTRCERCGSQGFNLHQHATKTVKDPARPRASVVRYICKRCRKTIRLYPDGVDSTRQTAAVRQASVILYWLGLSYDGIREYLGRLDCPLSKATVWSNVRESGVLGSRRRLRADAGTLAIQGAQDGVTARFDLKGRAITLGLSRGNPDELVLWVDALHPDAARLVGRRMHEVARKLRLQAEELDGCEATHA